LRELAELPSEAVEAIIEPGETLIRRWRVGFDACQGEALGQLGRTAAGVGGGRLAVSHKAGRTVVIVIAGWRGAVVVGMWAAPWPQLLLAIRPPIAASVLVATSGIVVWAVPVGSWVWAISLLDAFKQGRIEDDGIEPLPDRHAGAARGFLRGVARLPPDSIYVPRNARFHARIRMLDREGREPRRPCGTGTR